MNPKFFKTPSDFRKWLAAHHSSAKELWVGFYKKESGKPSITWPQSVEEALCFGWIDGWFKLIDTERWAIRYTPRRKRSNWSKYNIATAWNLLNEQRMTPAGVAKIPKDVLEIWEKYRPQATVIVRVTQGREIRFADWRNHLSMVRLPA